MMAQCDRHSSTRFLIGSISAASEEFCSMHSEPAADVNAKPSEDGDDSLLITSITSAWNATANKLIGAAAAISDAGNAVAAKAVEIGVDAAKEIADSSTSVLSGARLSSAIEYLDNALEEHGIKDALSDTADAVSDKLDQVTGKQLVELLEAKLRRQDEYNDILATRLSEALRRIAALEKRLGNEH